MCQTLSVLEIFIAMMVVTMPAAGEIQFDQQVMSVDGRVIWAEGADINGDGAADIVVVFRRGIEPATQRFVAVFYQQSNGKYHGTADEERVISEDTSFATVADINNDNKAEIVLVNAQGVSAYTFQQGKLSLQPEVLIQTETAAVFAEAEDLPEWQFVADWHKSGHTEIAVWQVGALQFYRMNKAGKFERFETLHIRPATWTDSDHARVFQAAFSNRNLSIALGYAFPELVVGDYDGSGHADLFVLEEDRVQIFGHKNGGHFSETPTVVLDFRIRTQEERHRKNSYIKSLVADLNGDGRSDYINNKITGGLASMSSETHVHLNQGGFRKAPDQIIKRDGFSGVIQLSDIEGDGRPELIEPFAEIGLITLARAMISKKLTVDWLVTPNHDGKFDVRGSHKLAIVFALDFSGGAPFKGFYPSAKYDFDGDGIPDFITSPEGKTLEVFLGSKKGLFSDEPSVQIGAELSPYTAIFVDQRTQKPNLLTYFRDIVGKEGRIVVLQHR